VGSVFPVGLLLILAPPPEAAPALPAGLSEEERQRLWTIEQTLLEEQGPARLWWWGWIGIYGVASAGEAVLWGTLHEPKLVANARVGTVTAGLGFLATLITGFPPASAASSLKELPDSTPDQARKKLAAAEALLVECADAESFGRSWFPHTGALLVNGAAAIFLWRHDDDPASAVLTFVLGELVAEAQIWTQPMASSELLGRIAITPLPGGLAVTGSF
jgi:hypothetical protein